MTLEHIITGDRDLTFATEVTGELMVNSWYIFSGVMGKSNGCTEKSRLEKKSRLKAECSVQTDLGVEGLLLLGTNWRELCRMRDTFTGRLWSEWRARY